MTPPQLGVPAYILAALAYVPGLGLLLGLPSIGWGIYLRAAGGLKVALMAAGGVAINAALYAAIFYFVWGAGGDSPSGFEAEFTRTQLRETVRDIEYWRLQHGQYPDSLEQLPQDLLPREDLHYRLADDRTHYWLRAVGRDGDPFTDDDLLPVLPDSERVHTGLLVPEVELERED